jgi:CDP-4-dehydro-6-deoxyglucose reductase
MSSNLYNIHINGHHRDFECVSTDTILEAGLRNGLAMRYECSNGSCGSCKASITSGNISLIKHHDYVLSEQHKQNNTFLMCCNSPETDLTIDVDLIGDASSIPIQKIITKVKKITFVNDSLAIINIKTPRTKALQFMAGQDVELTYNGYTSRYPIASCPCHGMELEFHIRNLPTDFLAQSIFDKSIKFRSIISLEGPKGIFVLNEESTRPMTFIAWDSGFAPIRSLAEHAFSLELTNPIKFYWAFPDNESKPYLNNHARSWNAIVDDYSYNAISCSPNQPNTDNYKGITITIFNSLDLSYVNESDVYISAPAEILIFLSELLLENGLDPVQLKASPC